MSEAPTIYGPGSVIPAASLAARLLIALRSLTRECVPHPCGGFTTDDMEWRMGTAFTGEDDAIGYCYEIAANDLLQGRAAAKAILRPGPRTLISTIGRDARSALALAGLLHGRAPREGRTTDKLRLLPASHPWPAHFFCHYWGRFLPYLTSDRLAAWLAVSPQLRRVV